MSESSSKTEHFDVFLCHNSEDKAEIRQIADELTRRGYKPWLDEREILAGTVWQEVLGRQIGTIKAAAVFVGKSGISPWQQMEIRTLIDQFVKRACPVIPVILSSATEMPELPIFLQNFHWVDFRKPDSDPYKQLINGIAGKKSDLVREEISVGVLLEPSQDDAEGRVHSPIANPPDQRQQEQLGILRDRVQEYWVDGVLRQSLYHEVLILLDKRTMDEVVERPPWKYDVVDLPDHSRNVLPQDYTINTVFDATGLLLILGEPGSGKTTSLLELAAVLINRAKNDPKERVPIVLSLSNWQKKQTFEEWIAAELSSKYRVPRSITRTWLKQNYLVPLLDGLDELHAGNQPDCVMAINTFIETYNPPGVVICSRLMEYQWLPKKLKLNGAVCVEPLTTQDVNDFLVAGGPQLTGLQQALASDPELQNLAQTPLMLSIMSLAFEGADGGALADHKEDSLEARRERIFQLYVQRMFERKKSITSPFSQGEAIRWLTWLARKMKERSVFLLEEIHPTWLSSTGQRLMYEGVLAIGVGLLFSLLLSSFGSVSNLYDLMWLHGVPDSSGVFLFMLTSIMSYFTWAVIIGVSIFLGCRSASPAKNGALSGLLGGFFFGLQSLMLEVLIKGSWDGGLGAWDFGILAWVSWGIFPGLLGGVGIGLLREIHPVEVIARQFWKKMISGLKIGFIAGASVGSLGMLLQYISGTEHGLLLTLVFGLGGALIFAVAFGLIGGFLGKVIDRDKADNVSPNEGIHLSLKNGLRIYGYMVGLVGLGVVIGLFLGRESSDVASWCFFGLWLSGVFGLKRGGSAVLKHYSLRLILWLTGATPSLPRFIPFLDHCAKLILIKKVGGGYMFIHRSLLEYFAALPLQDNSVKKISPGSAS